MHQLFTHSLLESRCVMTPSIMAAKFFVRNEKAGVGGSLLVSFMLAETTVISSIILEEVIALSKSSLRLAYPLELGDLLKLKLVILDHMFA